MTRPHEIAFMAGDEPSREAHHIFRYLRRHGGSVRARQLLRFGGLERNALVEALAELHERYWIVFNRRDPPPGASAADWEEAAITRITVTRFGRRKNRSRAAPRGR